MDVEAAGYALDQRGHAAAKQHHDLREAVVAGDEVAVGIGGQQRHVADILVGQQDAELQRVGLDVGPGRHVLGAIARQCC